MIDIFYTFETYAFIFSLVFIVIGIIYFITNADDQRWQGFFGFLIGCVVLYLLIQINTPSREATTTLPYSSSQGNLNPNENNNQQKMIISHISALYFTENDLSKLNTKFSSENLEFRYCLFGESFKDGVLITSMSEPNYQSRSATNMVATACPSTSIGFIHSHPVVENCLLSQGDISTLNSEPFPIQGVICERNRLTFYSKGDTKNFIPIYSVSTNSNNAIYSRDITPKTSCVGERFCDGACWNGCGSHEIWHCTANGGQCDLDPKNCPSYAPNSCLGTCWDGCREGGVWSCTSQGGHCQY